MTISFALSGTGASTFDHIDISQCVSLINRRFYRQGLEWAVAGFTVFTDSGITGNIAIGKLPDTWMCDNAYTKAYHAWKDQQDNAIEEAGGQSAVAKYRDFKISMNTDHVDAGFAGNLLPEGFVAGVNTGEWERSRS